MTRAIAGLKNDLPCADLTHRLQQIDVRGVLQQIPGGARLQDLRHVGFVGVHAEHEDAGGRGRA